MARSMNALGRSVLRRARQAHYARAICGALCVFALAFACAIQRGAGLGDPEALGLAALLGLVALAAWVRSETVKSRDVLQRVDQRLHLSGAFLAAQESCAQSPDSPISQLGAARLLQRIRPSQALEAAVPHTLGFVALPLFGLLVLVQTVQSRDERRGLGGLVTVEVGAVADRIADLADKAPGGFTDEQMAELAEIQRKAREAAQKAANESMGLEPDPALNEKDWREELREAADELDALARETPQGSDLAEELSEVAAAAEALAMDPEAGEAESGDGPRAGDAEGGGSGMAPEPSSPAADDASEGPAEGPSDPGAGELVPAMAAASEGDPGEGDPAEGASSGASSDDQVEATVDGVAAVAASESAAGSGSGPIDGAAVISTPDQEAAEGGAGAGAVVEGSPDRAIDEAKGAEEVLQVRPWWSQRDDAIVRAWLARQGLARPVVPPGSTAGSK